MSEAGLEKTQKNSFEKQFAKREMFETAGGTAEVVDIRPDKMKDDVPVFFAPAWACTLPIYKIALKTEVEQGRRTISLNHPRTGGEVILRDDEKELVADYPPIEVQKALTIIDILQKKEIETTDVIAHSEGSINSAIAALLLARRAKEVGKEAPIQNMVFFGPPGLIGEDTFPRLLKGFAGQNDAKPTLAEMPSAPEASDDEKIRTDTVGGVPINYPEIRPNAEAQESIVGPGKIPVVIKELGKFTIANPLRSFQEGWGMSQVHMEGLISKLREYGIGIVIMSAVDDPVFPTERMATLLKKGSVDGFLSVRGGHGQIGDNPERYMVAANQMLENLRNRKK